MTEGRALMTISTRLPPPWMARISPWLLAAGIAGSALAVGTVHTITLCIVNVVLAVAAVLGWWGAEPMRARGPATVLLVTGVGLTSYTALQCVPMPIGWLQVIAPYNAQIWARALAPLHEGAPAWAPISLDPGASCVEVLKGMTYVLAFVTAVGIARRREGVTFLSLVIVVTGLALAAAALLHPAFGAHKLFGLYSPSQGVPERHIAPLMDPNNLAGYLNVAFCLSLAVLIAPEPRVPRPIAGAAVLLLTATQVWVASRGGVVAMVLGALIVLAISRASRAPRGGVVTLSLVSGVGIVVGAVLIVLGGSEGASSELLDADVSKLRLVAQALRMVPSMPVFGCGRGAFESAFAAFRTEPGVQTYTYPENFVAQWVVEWGVPIGLAGLLLLARALGPRAVLARSTTAGGAWAAIVVLVVQNLSDLGTEVPGLMLAGVVCASIVAAGTSGGSATSWLARWGRRPRRIAYGAAIGAAAALALAGAHLGKELHDDQYALYAAAEEGVAGSRMHALARAAMRRHPAAPYLPFVTAVRAVREHDDSAMSWIGATLERAPVYPGAHVLVARIVAARSPSQARLEYRLGMEQAPILIGEVMAEAPRVVGSGYFTAMELVPEGPTGVPVLEALAAAIDGRLPATRVMLDAELARRAPAAPGPARRAATDAVDDLEAGDAAPWCTQASRDSCQRDALAKAARLQQIEPDMCEGYALRARVRAAAGDGARGLAELGKAVDRVRDRVPCLEQLVAVALEAGDRRQADRALDMIVSAGCADDAECARNLAWVGGRAESIGNPRKALALFKRAYERAPGDDALLEHIARLAANAGLHAEAAGDYERLARKYPEELRWRQAAQAEHAAALREAVRL